MPVVVVLAVLLSSSTASRLLLPSVGTGPAGVGVGRLPVVEVAGLGSAGDGFASLTASLRDRGVPVLDFDARRSGVQPLTYRDVDDRGIDALAVRTVAPAISQALRRAGYGPRQRVDVVAHSTGGLAMRFLVERQPGWARRVDDLVMVATPNHGSSLVWLETRGGRWPTRGADMRPGSSFLRGLGGREPAGEVYTTVGGAPLLTRLLPPALWFDDQVPTGSPRLEGAANYVYPSLHGRLLRNPDVVELVEQVLRAR